MSTGTCDISFVIVSWNARAFLHDCLVSLKRATAGLATEVIVVDNASADGSWEMVQRDFPEVVLLRQESNTGFARANNRGIAVAQGRYVCLVNSDVQVFSDSITTLFAHMEAHKRIGILGPKVLNPDLTLQPSCRNLPSLRSSFLRALCLDTFFPRSRFFGDHFMTYWDYGDTREVAILSGCFWFIRREAIDAVGLLDTRFFMYGEDMDFCKRFLTRGWKVVFCDKARIIHFGGGSSARAPSRFWVEMQRANLQYWLLHHNRLSVLVYFGCVWLHHMIRFLGLLTNKFLGHSDRAAVNAKLELNWCGLRWLAAPHTVRAVLLGKWENGQPT